MMHRRGFITGATAAGAVLALPAPAVAKRVVRLPSRFFPQEVAVRPELAAGEIHVETARTYLYWTLGNGRAIRYGIAVGAAGRNLKGRALVGRKAKWPSWRPTTSMIRAEPHIYRQFAEGLPGGHAMNPLGSRALYLHRGGRDTLYRIHGTPQPWTIGQSFGSGCIRLVNDHVEDLYGRVPKGARVVVY